MVQLKVAIVGKPNVGKSTFFNRLCSKKLSIVSPIPGITRDRKESNANIVDIKFTATDTAGWEREQKLELKALMVQQTKIAIQEANLVMFVIDARQNINSDDIDFAKLIQKSSKQVLLIVNKCESKIVIDTNDIYALGFGEPVFISAEHGLGFDALYYALQNIIADHSINQPLPDKQADVELAKSDKHILTGHAKISDPISANGITENATNNNYNISDQTLDIPQHKQESLLPQELRDTDRSNILLAIVGRPNVGKSTIFNQILGFTRVITSAQAGTTRDSITYDISVDNNMVSLIDTAGMRKKSKVHDNIESLSLGQTITAIRRAHIVALIVDATQAFENQDLSIAQLAIHEGKGVVIVVNKEDLVVNRKQLHDNINHITQKYFSEISNMPIVYTSAIHNHNIKSILKEVIALSKKWEQNFTTRKLNKWLKAALNYHLPPIAQNNRRIKLKYITQTASKPPTFSLFTNLPEEVPNHYTKYLINSLRNYLALSGIPIRLNFKKTLNPYIK